VRLIAADGRRIQVSVGKSGAFSVRVPAGRYHVIAGLKRPMDWPMGSCAGLFGPDTHFDHRTNSFYVVVGTGQTARVIVACVAI
jgi:hypothetical protein